MYTLFVVGLVLLALGLVAVFVPAITFFTNKRVADAGFFSISMAKPHTIVFNPIVGMVCLVGGIILMIMNLRP